MEPKTVQVSEKARIAVTEFNDVIDRALNARKAYITGLADGANINIELFDFDLQKCYFVQKATPTNTPPVDTEIVAK